jgi:hypothetical protein
MWRAVSQPFHSGTPPHLIATACGLGSIVLGVAMLVFLIVRRSIPLAVSAAVLLCFGLSFTVLGHEVSARSVPGANLKALEKARALHEQINAGLQKTGSVPTDVPVEGESPYRRRDFSALPWRLVHDKTDATQPGTLLLEVSADRATFSLKMVGIDSEGTPTLLRDEHGEPVELRGAFNPDTRE